MIFVPHIIACLYNPVDGCWLKMEGMVSWCLLAACSQNFSCLTGGEGKPRCS